MRTSLYIPRIALIFSALLLRAFSLRAQAPDSWTRRADVGTGRADAPVARFGPFAFSIDGTGYVGSGTDEDRRKDLWAYDTATKVWTQKADFPTLTRVRAISFVIGKYAYVGGGEITGEGRTDFYRYDPAANSWDSRANIGGGDRMNAFSFSIGGKGYAGGGKLQNGDHLTDFWEYDTTADSWTRKADFRHARASAAAFSLGSQGYIVGGDSASVILSDVQRYDPATNSWTAKASFPGGAITAAQTFQFPDAAYIVSDKNSGGGTGDLWQYADATDSWIKRPSLPDGHYREGAGTFTIGTKGYLSCGAEYNAALGDLYVFDTAAGSWSRGESFAGTKRRGAVSFSIKGKGYMGTGTAGMDYRTYQPVYTRDFWSYDTASDTWTQVADFAGGDRAFAATFTIKDRAYVATGRSSAGETDDMWEYNPAANQWTAKAAYPGGMRYGAAAFAIDSVGYLGTGIMQSSSNDAWYVYDPRADAWSKRASFPSPSIANGSGFTVGRRGFVIGGALNQIWEYLPANDSWQFRTYEFSLDPQHMTPVTIGGRVFITGIGVYWLGAQSMCIEYDPDANVTMARTAIPGGRYGAFAFTIGNRAFVGGGSERVWANDYNNYRSDFWEYTPPGITTLPGTVAVCASSQTPFSVTAATAETFDPANTFLAELSDMAGDFSAPQQLLPLPGSSATNLILELPAGLPHSNGYRLRVVSSHPAITGSSVSLQFYSLSPAISWSGATLQAPPGYASYKWLYYNAEIPGATQPAHAPQKAGHYSVAVSDSFGCTGISAGIAVTGVSVQGQGGTGTAVYPNPVRNFLHLDGGPFDVSICGVDGREQIRKSACTGVDMRGLTPGMYLLKMTDARTGYTAFVRIVREP